MSKVQTTGFDPKAIDDAKVFSEIAFMKGMEAAKETAENETADALLTR